MGDKPDVRSFRIHFDGHPADAHVLPAPVLVDAITQIQRVVYLLAKMHRREPLGRRVTFSRTLREQFALLCRLPEPGSYTVPFVIGQEDASLLPLPDIDDVSRLFGAVTQAVGEGGSGPIRELVPDDRYLGLLADAYQAAQPSARSGVSLSIEDHQCRRILDGRRAAQALYEMRDVPLPQSRVFRDTISGLLVGMNFHKRNVRLMRSDGKFVTVSYDQDAERPLIDRRRDWIQVSGDVVYDIDDQPVSVKHAHGFVALDEDPIELREMSLHNVAYRADPPLRFVVTHDPDDGLYDLVGDFGISLSAESRPLLLEELNEALSMLWLEYADEQPEVLSAKARRLRAKLRERLRAA